MTFITALTLFILATSAMAACPQQAKEAFSSFKKTMEVSWQTYKTFYSAINHYRHDVLQPEGSPYMVRSLMGEMNQRSLKFSTPIKISRRSLVKLIPNDLLVMRIK